jgi:CO/xanthine dehydrogenase Mo-binding subunit
VRPGGEIHHFPRETMGFAGSALGFTYMNYAGTQIALVAQPCVDRKSGKVLVPKVWVALDPGVAVQPDNIWHRRKAVSSMDWD